MNAENLAVLVNSCLFSIKNNSKPSYYKNTGMHKICNIAYLGDEVTERNEEQKVIAMQKKHLCPLLSNKVYKVMYNQVPGFCLGCEYNGKNN